MRLKLTTAPAIEPVTLDEARNHLKIDSSEDNSLISALITTARQLAEKETKRAFITQTWEMYLDEVGNEIEIPKPPLQSIVSIKTISTVESYVDETSAADQPILLVASTTGFWAGSTIWINRDGEREEEMAVLSIQEGVSLTLTANLTNAHTETQGDRVEKYSLVSKEKYLVDISQNSPGRVKLRSGYTWPTHRGFASFLIEFNVGFGDTATDIPGTLKQGMQQLVAYLYENRGAEKVTTFYPPIPESIKAMFWPYKILRI